ncbi:hypothetical protein CROQUDRAFT_650911 [Cronartium quercuum f. sp. fusiforme G11]|uniref:Uncharacterized protein n=1 Tax=Cronartium quercuum f. sp. fusiforme G11 TaxID=708437 RepID=A0A9P6NW98_9BASI|nr:hypothetical protein CROQUDRAFT_650911 [Cronartium quercuum f. sp. fusiforme G11]
MNDDHSAHPPTLGLLHLYSPHARLTAFESGDYESPHTIIFIGGLGDGLSAVPYLTPLSDALQEIEWSVTQVLLTSSYAGFGCTNIETDAREIGELLTYLRKLGKTKFVLLGHSTGCQDIVKLVNDAKGAPGLLQGVVGTILQAPVSDREYIVETLGQEAHQRSLTIASELVSQGQPNHPIPSEFSEMFSGGRCSISASRWLSLASKLEDNPSGEDFFSSDLSVDQLKGHLRAFEKIPTMVLHGSRDESMPSGLDKQALLGRLTEGLGGAEAKEWSKVFEGAGHQAEEVIDEICERIVNFIKAIF